MFDFVLGSYQPSASSPRFLRELEFHYGSRACGNLKHLPLSHEALPSSFDLFAVEIFDGNLLLDIKV